jgi:predicted nucleic acid-binding protein
MFLIDTDVLSALAKRRRPADLEAWIDGQRTSELFISVISVGEIERGIAMQRRRDSDFASMLATWLDQVLNVYGDRVLPFDLAAARRWGELSAALGHHGADHQIAATALEHGLTVVTRNVSHFEPTGVSVLDPFNSPLRRKP